MPHQHVEVGMRVVGWVVGVLALGLAAGFVAGLLRPRRTDDYHPTYDAPHPLGG
jgi:hypothetical protein